MDHLVGAYLRRLPTETLEVFLRDYGDNAQFRQAVAEVTQELARRNRTQNVSKTGNGSMN